MTKYYVKKQQAKVMCKPGSMLEPFVPDCAQDTPLATIYCSGDTIPLQSIGLVKVCLNDGTEVCLAHGSTVPSEINGFVLFDQNTKKLKYIPGKAPSVDPVEPESIQELFTGGDFMPESLKGYFAINGLIYTAGSKLPDDLEGFVIYDEVTNKARHIVDTDTQIEESRVSEIATQIVLDNAYELDESEVIAIVQSVVDQIDILDENQVKQIAEACIATLPPDQVRSDAEILALVTSVTSQLPPDTVRSDAEIKVIAQNCFADLADEFLSASEVFVLIDQAIDDIPQFNDTVRSDAEIKLIADACFESQDTLTSAEVQLLILQLMAANGEPLSENQIKLIVQDCIDELPPARTDAQVKAIAQTCVDALPVDQVRTDEEITLIVNTILASQPSDMVRSDEEIKAIAQACAQAIVDALPDEQVRSDAEIKAIAEVCAQGLIRTDAEINALIQAFYDGLPQAQGDTVRSDAEIKAIAQACIDVNARTDAQVKAIVQACIDTLPAGRTDAQVKAIAQACVDALPPDQVRTDEEIQVLINAAIADLPIDEIDEIEDVENIITEGFSHEIRQDPDAPCYSYSVLMFNGVPIKDVDGNDCRTPYYRTAVSTSMKRCYYGITGVQTVQIETVNNGGFTVDFGHPVDGETDNDIQSGNNGNTTLTHDFGLEPVSGCIEITSLDPCDTVSIVILSPELLQNSQPGPQCVINYA